MNHGRIVQVGTPSDIYESPSNRFVADFIGSVNMFEGQVSQEGPEGIRVTCTELGATMRIERTVSCERGAIVWTAIRPEKISISRRQPAAVGGENVVRGTVREIAYMGDLSIYLVQIDSGKMVRVTLPNMTRFGSCFASPSRRCGWRFRLTHRSSPGITVHRPWNCTGRHTRFCSPIRST
jgi:putrescine transport system ATP-binding protein